MRRRRQRVRRYSWNGNVPRQRDGAAEARQRVGSTRWRQIAGKRQNGNAAFVPDNGTTCCAAGRRFSSSKTRYNYAITAAVNNGTLKNKGNHKRPHQQRFSIFARVHRRGASVVRQNTATAANGKRNAERVKTSAQDAQRQRSRNAAPQQTHEVAVRRQRGKRVYSTVQTARLRGTRKTQTPQAIAPGKRSENRKTMRHPTSNADLSNARQRKREDWNETVEAGSQAGGNRYCRQVTEAEGHITTILISFLSFHTMSRHI